MNPTRARTAAAAALAAVALAACAPTPAQPDPASEPSETTSSAPATPTPSTESEPEPEPTVEPEPEATPEVGALERPAAYSTPFEGETWRVSVDAVNGETANAVIAQDDMGIEPENGQFVIATITATNVSAVIADGYDLTGLFSLVGADKLIYPAQPYNYLDDALDEAPQALPGGTVTGRIVFDVPPEAVGDKAISATSGESGEMTVWSATGS